MRRWRLARRLGALSGLVYLLFVGYRVFFVYTFSPRPCAAPATAGEPVSDGAAGAGSALTSAPSSAAGAVELKVLSYNIGGHTALLRRRHVAAIARLIAAERPDVVGLQEVHRYSWQARFRDQAEELARATGMAMYFGPSFRALGGEFGNAVLVRGRVLSGEVLALPSFGEPRSLLRTTVEVAGLELDVYVTHLTAWGSLNRRTRAAQARCLADQVGGSRRPFVLCGDLNAVPAAADLAGLLASERLRLCGLASEPTHAVLGRRLDYVFSDPRFEVLSASVLREGPSDHWPVLARLRWPGGG